MRILGPFEIAGVIMTGATAKLAAISPGDLAQYGAALAGFATAFAMVARGIYYIWKRRDEADHSE